MKTALVVLHILVALVVLSVTFRTLGNRTQDVSSVRQLAEAEHAQTAKIQAETMRHQQLLAGLRNRDPYVVELLARDRLQFARPGELSPPSQPVSRR